MKLEFCAFLRMLLEKSGLEITDRWVDYDWDENAVTNYIVKTPEELLKLAGYSPISELKGEYDPLYMFCNYAEEETND